MHQAERNLRLVEHLGFVAKDRRLVVAIPDSARGRIPSLLKEKGIDPDVPFILVHPGASAKARRYPAARFGQVADLLSKHG
jgi:ADP-heptose:LPS heptosyltransferase